MTTDFGYSAASRKLGYVSLSASIGVDVDAHTSSSKAAPAQTGSVVSMNHTTAAVERSAVVDLDISMIVSLSSGNARLLDCSFRDPKPTGGSSVILVQTQKKYTLKTSDSFLVSATHASLHCKKY